MVYVVAFLCYRFFVLFSHCFNYWKMQRASRPPQDRTMVVACLAEVAQDMGPPIAGYVDVNFITLKYFPAIYFWSLKCKKLCLSTGRSKCYQNSPLSINCSLFLSQLTSLFIFHFLSLESEIKRQEIFKAQTQSCGREAWSFQIKSQKPPPTLTSNNDRGCRHRCGHVQHGYTRSVGVGIGGPLMEVGAHW